METQSNQIIASLQSNVAHLTNLVERVNTLRKIPALLLAPSTLTGSQLEQGFGQISDLKSTVAATATQECLKHAQESFSSNQEHVGLDVRKQSRKRRRPPSPSPESPRTPPVLPQHIFPPTPRVSPLTQSELSSYVRGQNQLETTLKLHIWTPTRPRRGVEVADPSSRNIADTVVRISIKDVLYAYVRLGAAPLVVNGPAAHVNPGGVEEDLQEERLVVESVSVFGPRERKSPHSQSDYAVFEKLSQHVSWMLQAEPGVELQSLVALFKSYESLFVTQCTVCHRILSEEGHFPPVCRVWMPTRKSREATSAIERESGGDGEGRWEARHRACLNSLGTR